MKVGFFGGSFDPPHLGHKKIVDYCIKKFDKLLIIPNRDSVDKHKKNIATINQRFEMLNLMFKNKLVEISDFEIKSNQPNYTYNTIKFLEDLYKGDDLFMIIGKDQLENLYNWHQYEYIIKNINIICFNRNDIMERKAKQNYTIKSIKHLKFSCNHSSEKIREMLENNIQFDICPLDEKVLEYIIKNNIYK